MGLLSTEPTALNMACHQTQAACALLCPVMQERLQRLKKEQAEADSAREAAWRQLKAVVSEISRLAAPEAKAATAQAV